MLRIGDTDGVVNIVGTSSLEFNKYRGSLLDAHIYIPLDRPFLSKHIASSLPEYIAGGILSAGCLTNRLSYQSIFETTIPHFWRNLS